jgi:transposase
LDTIPAEIFVPQHICGKWACRCYQNLMQQSAVAQMIAGDILAAGLVAHTLVSCFVDHVPYYRQKSINTHLKMHTARSTLAN